MQLWSFLEYMLIQELVFAYRTGEHDFESNAYVML